MAIGEKICKEIVDVLQAVPRDNRDDISGMFRGFLTLFQIQTRLSEECRQFLLENKQIRPGKPMLVHFLQNMIGVEMHFLELDGLPLSVTEDDKQNVWTLDGRCPIFRLRDE